MPRFACLAKIALAPIALAPFALAVLLAGPASAEPGDVLETVKAFYVPTIWNPLEVDAFSGVAEPALSIFEKNAAKTASGGEAGCIDFVPTIDGQDYDDAEIARSLSVEETGEAEDGAKEITARFTLFQEKKRVVWTMVEVDGVWKVSDIEGPDSDWRLSEFLCD